VGSIVRMIPRRLLQVLMCSSAAVALSACGMFGSKPAQPMAAAGSQEFDPFSNSWKASEKIVTPPPSEPNVALAEQQAAAKREASALNKAGRAMSSTVSVVGRAVKKPLGWLPFGKKDTATDAEAKPAVQ
jgi:hypothetical protein